MPEDPNAGQETTEGAEGAESHDSSTETRTDWKAEARKWEQRAKDNAAKLKDAAPKLTEYEQLKAANQTAEERQAQELTRWQSEAETWRQHAVGSRIETFAAAAAEYPDMVVKALSANNYLDAGGQINDEQIQADVAEFLEQYPKLARSGEPAGPVVPRPPAPNPAQGSGGGRPVANPASELAAIIQGHLNRA